MTPLAFERNTPRDRLGLKGPGAAAWLSARGIAGPAAVAAGGEAGAIMVARLGTGEFFLEDAGGGTALRALHFAAEAHPPGVYPVLREDAAFSLSGRGSLDVLAQTCNVNFADLELDSRPVIMTLMIGIAVLVVPRAADGLQRFRIWCDPTFGEYLEKSLASVVRECGGSYSRQPSGGDSR